MQTAGMESEASQVRVGYDEALALLDSPEAPAIVRAGAELGVLDEDRARTR